MCFRCVVIVSDVASVAALMVVAVRCVTLDVNFIVVIVSCVSFVVIVSCVA